MNGICSVAEMLINIYILEQTSPLFFHIRDLPSIVTFAFYHDTGDFVFLVKLEKHLGNNRFIGESLRL